MSTVLIEANEHFHREAPVGDDVVLNISEFFADTIQGEGINMGFPAIFIRLQDCSLDCVYCFALKPSRRIPKITMATGPFKKLNEIKKGDVLLTFDEKTKKLVETTVINTIHRKVTLWQEIVTNGHTYFVTPEHPFFTTKGILKNACDLIPGDEIFHSNQQQRVSYSMKKYNPMFQKESLKKAKQNTDWKALGEKISKTIKQKQINKTYVNPITTLKKENPEQYKECIKKQSERMKGKSNPNWKGGSLTPNYDLLKNKLKRRSYKCDICNINTVLEVHHIDKKHQNDSIENLAKVCHACHSKIHKRGFNFWNGKRSDSKKSSTNAEMALNGIKIISNKKIDITKHPHFGRSYGPNSITAYNLTCAPHNSYLIDNMWVHNCDSNSVWRYGNPYTVNELLDMLSPKMIEDLKSESCHFILTGGSPLRQQFELEEFFREFLKKYGFLPYVEIENECTLRPSSAMIGIIQCWNNSPKLAASQNSRPSRYKENTLRLLSGFHNSWFKFVITCTEDWNEIEQDFLIPGLIKKEQIILMPEGDTRDKLMLTRSMTVKLAVEKGVRYSDRLHIIIWNKRTGV